MASNGYCPPLPGASYPSLCKRRPPFKLLWRSSWLYQDALAARYPTNPLLQVRGNAGTHDLALALRTIRAVAGRGKGGGGSGRSGDAESAGIRVPRYDKSARGGKGDRAPDDDWGVVAERPDIVLLEGWMLGFEALPDESSLLVSAGKENDGGYDTTVSW